MQPQLQPEPEGLEAEVRDLAARVARLEHALGLVAPASTPPVAQASTPVSSPLETHTLLPVLGRALLGLAGAYLLRAVTESGTLAPKVGVGVGLLYAILWLVWAARTPAARRLEAALHSLTSVLVLAPLLWEATLRFHTVSTWTAGAILLFFTVFGLAISWQKDLLIVATIATLAGLGTAAALLLATHDVLPFTFVFLAIAAAVEASACLDHWLSERWLAATAADLSVLLATWLVTNPRGLPPVYAPIPHAWLLAAQVALLAIYLSSTIIRTLLRGVTFTVFETAQCAVAFLISVWGGLGPAMALVTLACGAACYVVSFVMLDRPGSRGRNFYTYSTFGILLVIAGSRILLAGSVADAVWSLLAVACVWAGASFGRQTLQVHGGTYLLLALVTSGALAQAAAFLVGTASWPGANDVALVAGAAAAAVCYWLVGQDSRPVSGPVLRFGAAATLACLLAGIAAGLLTAGYHEVFGEAASHAYCATLRTTVVAVAALLLAWAGSRWDNLELSRLIYPAMALGAYRLLTDDLHQDRKAALFLSLLVYGSALIALPRLKKARA
ncbi:conserved membrane hypothetical protein [Candidatus Sulfopaludibacter sp. SbA4]|nr:conserved membrane hypothetical protein [Candidatus Sulfopaludibacter sp. SbA4]